MLSKERQTLDALEIDVSSPYQLAPSESQTTEVGENEEDKEKQEDVENTSFHETTWEQRYEKIWVEIEKKETKSQYKNVTAELKERFGEIEQKAQSETAQDQEAKEEKEEGNENIKKDVPVGASEEDSSEDEEELIVRPTTRARSVQLLPIPEQRESGQEESYSEDLPNNDFAKHKDIQQHSLETLNETAHETLSSSYQRSGYSADAFSNISENIENLRLAHSGDLETSFAMNQESSQEAGISPLHLVGEPRILPSIPDAVSCNSEELVEEGLQRSINEVGKWRRRKSQLCSSNLRCHVCLFHFLSFTNTVTMSRTDFELVLFLPFIYYSIYISPGCCCSLTVSVLYRIRAHIGRPIDWFCR